MPRTSTGGEDTVLAATARKTYYRVKVADPDGVLQDLASYASYGWTYSAEIDETIDQPIAACTVKFVRDINIVGGLGLTSLSPLRTDSPANPDGAAVTVNRASTVDMAVVTGSRPVDASTDWKPKFVGITDRVSDINTPLMQVMARDKGAILEDQIGPTSGNAVPGGPRKIEDVMNSIILNASVGNAYSPYPTENVYLPAAITYAVRSLPYNGGTVMDACEVCAGLPGADFRYRWHEGTSTYRPTLTMPDRAPSGTSFTMGSQHIVGWRQLEIDRLGVRNVVIVNYRRKSDGLRVNAVAEDEDSKVLYGRRVLLIQEGDDSSIDTAEEAEDLAALVLSDTMEPTARAEVEILPDWRIELNDYITFPANRFFDIDQDLAVTGIRHVLEPNSQRTFLSLRGKPSGGYKKWLSRAASFDDANPSEADNGLTAVTYTDSANGTRTWSWNRGINVSFVAFYNKEIAAPVTGSSYPSPDTIPALVATGTSGASMLSTTTDSWVAVRPELGFVRIGMAVPFYKLGGGFACGAPVKFQHEGASPLSLIARARVLSSTTTELAVRVAVADPFPQGANSVTITYTEMGGTGTACSPASGQTLTPAATLTEDGGTYVDFTITRPAFLSGTRRVTFTASASGRQSASDAIDVPEKSSGSVSAVVDAVYVASTDYGADTITVEWTYSGDLADGDFELVRIVTFGSTADHSGTKHSVAINTDATTPATEDDVVDEDITASIASPVVYSYAVRVRDADGLTLRVSPWFDHGPIFYNP